jgi:hypothetical protein
MGISASTDILFDDWKNGPLDVIKALLLDDWVNTEDAKVHYLPLYDNDQFNWKEAEPSDWEKILIELEQKSQSGEVIGIIILSKSLETGGHFYLHPREKTLSISWHINRKQINGSLLTDFDWYESRLIKPMLKSNLKIGSIQSEDMDSGGVILQSTSHDSKEIKQSGDTNHS